MRSGCRERACWLKPGLRHGSARLAHGHVQIGMSLSRFGLTKLNK